MVCPFCILGVNGDDITSLSLSLSVCVCVCVYALVCSTVITGRECVNLTLDNGVVRLNSENEDLIGK